MVDKLLGAKVRIDVNEEGSYEGFVHNIDEKSEKLTLVKVKSCTTGTKLHGLHQFFPNEINDFTVLEAKNRDVTEEVQKDKNPAPHSGEVKKNTLASAAEELADLEQSRGRGFPLKHHRNFSAKSLQKGKARRDPSDEGRSLLRRKPVKPSNYYSEVFADTTTNMRENVTINPPDVVVIDSYGEAFEKAVAYICRQRVVGVAWEGIKVGRFGTLCLIQIGCSKCIYIFDIVKLGERAFDSGLADIMDSGDILKVMHDCRHFSDGLYHQHGISLVNIFDTQVADVVIYKKENGNEFPRQTISLTSCLYEYLDLSHDEFHFHKVRLKLVKNDEYVWQKRPLDQNLIDVAAKSVMYLRELRLAQMESMMEDFLFGVDIYISCMKDASDEVVKSKYSSLAVPEKFHQLLKRRQRPRYRQVEPELDDSHNGEDPRDTWLEGHAFVEKCEQRGLGVREHKYPPLSDELGIPPQLRDESSQHTNLSSELGSAAEQLNISGAAAGLPVAQNVYEMKESASKFRPSGKNMGLRPASVGIFSQSDFPELSSDSDNSGRSPCSSSGMQHATGVRSSHVNSREPKVGRGRASALIRNTQMPSARLPNAPKGMHSDFEKPYHEPFPPDEELLSAPPIVSASDLGTVPSGSRVRISRQ